MLKVFVAQHPAQAHLVEDLLRSNGIEAHVVGESLLNTIPGSLIIPGTAPEVWLLDATQAGPARELLRRFTEGLPLPATAGPAWACATCGETLESQFTACWNCGTARPGEAAPD